MAIILNIRKFFRLDNGVVKLDNDIVDAAGLIIVEKKDFMQQPVQQGCFGPYYVALPAKNELTWADHSLIDLQPLHHLHF